MERESAVNEDFLLWCLVAVSLVADEFPVPDQLIEDLLDPFSVRPIGLEIIKDAPEAGGPVRFLLNVEQQVFLGQILEARSRCTLSRYHGPSICIYRYGFQSAVGSAVSKDLILWNQGDEQGPLIDFASPHP